jgi:hypothetical protein
VVSGDGDVLEGFTFFFSLLKNNERTTISHRSTYNCPQKENFLLEKTNLMLTHNRD